MVDGKRGGGGRRSLGHRQGSGAGLPPLSIGALGPRLAAFVVLTPVFLKAAFLIAFLLLPASVLLAFAAMAVTPAAPTAPAPAFASFPLLAVSFPAALLGGRLLLTVRNGRLLLYVARRFFAAAPFPLLLRTLGAT